MAKWEKLYDDSVVPQRSTKKSVGYDLVAHESAVIGPRSRKLVKTGITVNLDDNEYLAIVPRSGLALKQGVTVLNTPGTIDPDYYPNEIGVILMNTSDDTFFVEPGDRIAQAILKSYFIFDNDKVKNEQRNGGFGSTGRS